MCRGRLSGKIFILFNGHNGADLKPNIGCGTCKFSGWTTIDRNFTRHPDMWLDVTRGLPFCDASVKVIYACHFFENPHLRELRPLLSEAGACCAQTARFASLYLTCPQPSLLTSNATMSGSVRFRKNSARSVVVSLTTCSVATSTG